MNINLYLIVVVPVFFLCNEVFAWLKITAGQRTMTGQKCLWTGHLFTLLVILTDNIFKHKPQQTQKIQVGRLLRPDIVHFHLACLGTEIFLRELTLSCKHAEFKSEKFPQRRPAVFSQTAILSSQTYNKFFIVQRHG